MKLSKLSVAILATLAASTTFAAPTQLDQVVVTANNTSQDLASVTSNIHVITREQIEARNYQNLGDAVKTVPGLSVKSTGGPGQPTSIFMRGQSSSDRKVLILIDGVDQSEATGFGPNVQNIQLDNVERIEILKGPQSGVWGSNASAGVINIITIKGQKLANVNLEMGSNNSRKIATTLGAGNDQVDFIFNFARTQTDGFTAVKPYKGNRNKYENDQFNQTDISFKMGLSPVEGHRLEAMIKTSSANADFDSQPNDTIENNDYQNQTRQLQYTYKKDALNGRLFINEQKSEMLSVSSFGPYNSEGITENFGAQLGLQYDTKNNVQASIERKQVRDIVNDKKYSNNSFGLSNTHFLTSNLVFNGALRYDEYDVFKDAVTGKVGLKNNFTKDVFVGANYGTAYNAPGLYQFSNTNISTLKPETVKSFDISLGVYGAEISYFESDIEDLIDTINYVNYFNTKGNSKVTGWEFSYYKNVKAIKTDVNLSATFLDAKTPEGKYKHYTPEQQASISLDNYSLAKTHFGLETRYVGTTYTAHDKKGAQIGEYFVADINADYQFNKSLNLYAKIVNIGNVDYVTSVNNSFPVTSTPSSVYDNGGIQWFVGIRGKL